MNDIDKILESVEAQYKPKPRRNGAGLGAVISECVAYYYPVSLIKTDEARFQNRNTAFSELSAQSVAENYDPNKFDPIVIWSDPKDNAYYVLSGHSRFEGIKRRGLDKIAAREFVGSESDAIKFAKIDSNRSANVESIVEDLKAYKLSVEGDPQKGIYPLTKKEIREVFKGKASKLEDYSNLDPNGLFIDVLKLENKTEFPYAERFAQWAGELRGEYPEMTNTHEADLFSFFYADSRNQKIKKDDLFDLVKKRLALGLPRIFPECDYRAGSCKPISDIKRDPPADGWIRRLEELQNESETLKKRFNTNNKALRIYTKEELSELERVRQDLLKERKELQDRLNKVEAGLFGIIKRKKRNV